MPCGIDNHLVWLHIKSKQQLRKHKSSCQMSKTMWSGMQVPRGLVWWKLHQLPIRLQTHRKNSPERTVKGTTTSSLNKCVLHLTCLTHLTSLKLSSRSCSEARCLLHKGNVSWAEVSSSGAPRKEQEEAVGIAITRVGFRGIYPEVYSLILQSESEDEAVWSWPQEDGLYSLAASWEASTT